MASGVVTLEQRKIHALKSMKDSIDCLKNELSSYAIENIGTFILFGSVARGDFRVNSDVDILVDFSDEKTSEAWRFAEDVCAKYKLKSDVRSVKFCTSEFIKRIMKDAVIIND